MQKELVQPQKRWLRQRRNSLLTYKNKFGIMNILDTVREFGGNFLKGKLTYTIAWFTLAWAGYGWFMGFIDTPTASTLISTSLIGIGIRRNMPNKE